jgi:glycosyltransferase involved in cell wall biosynthesis
MVAYEFPPVGGGGVQRTSKFVKYLGEFGWRPHVLTVRQPSAYVRDETLLADIPADTVIHRTRSIEPMRPVRRVLSGGGTAGSGPGGGRRKPSWLVAIKERILVPDAQILWLPFAVRGGLDAIRRHRPSAIYSTASPFTDHLIAMELARRTGLPWVADFRDYWVDRSNFPDSRWRRFADGRMERRVLERASHVVTATAHITERFAKRAPGQTFTTITNGFDDADFPSDTPPPPREFVVTYTGLLNRERTPVPFFRAWQALADRHPGFREGARLRLVGQLDHPGDDDNRRALTECGLDACTELLPHQPHHAAIEEMLRASVLFLLVGDYPHNEGIYTGKIFEYLRANRPILAVVPPKGLAAALVRETNAGIVAPTGTGAEAQDAIEAALEELFDHHAAGTIADRFSTRDIDAFSRRSLTSRLAAVLDGVTAP